MRMKYETKKKKILSSSKSIKSLNTSLFQTPDKTQSALIKNISEKKNSEKSEENISNNNNTHSTSEESSEFDFDLKAMDKNKEQKNDQNSETQEKNSEGSTHTHMLY